MLPGSSAPAASRFTTVRWRITSPSAAAIEVHRDKGPGLIESIYEWCMLKELGLRGLTCISQKIVVIDYKVLRERNRCDLMCWLRDAFWSRRRRWRRFCRSIKLRVLSYMKLLDVPIGLLINFHEMKVTDGISRLILPGANL